MLEAFLGTLSRFARSAGWVSAENLPMRKVMIRTLLFREGDRWCAQCLDFDIAVQAETRGDLIKELKSVLQSYVEIAMDCGHEPFAGLPKAPTRYFEFFERSVPGESMEPIRALNRVEAPSIIPTLRYLKPATV